MSNSSFGMIASNMARDYAKRSDSGSRLVDSMRSSYQAQFDKNAQVDTRLWKERFESYETSQNRVKKVQMSNKRHGSVMNHIGRI